MKKLNVLLSVMAMSFVMVGCGGGGSSTIDSTPIITDSETSEFEIGMDPSGVTDYEGFLFKYYEFGDEEDIPLIKNTTYLMGSRGITEVTYDENTRSSIVKVKFSHTADYRHDDLKFSGVTYNLVSEVSLSGETVVKTNTYRDRELVFDNFYSPSDLLLEGGSGNCSFTDTTQIIEDIECTLAFSQLSNKPIVGIKLNVQINSLEYDLATAFTRISDFMSWRFVDYYYLSSFVNLVIYDINTNQELGRIILN